MTTEQQDTIMRIAATLRPLNYDLSRADGIEYRPMRREVARLIDGDKWDCRKTSLEYVKWRMRRWLHDVFPEQNISYKGHYYPAEIIQNILQGHDSSERSWQLFSEVSPYVICKLEGLSEKIMVWKDEYGRVLACEDPGSGKVWDYTDVGPRCMGSMTITAKIARVNGVGLKPL